MPFILKSFSGHVSESPVQYSGTSHSFTDVRHKLSASFIWHSKREKRTVNNSNCHPQPTLTLSIITVNATQYWQWNEAIQRLLDQVPPVLCPSAVRSLRDIVKLVYTRHRLHKMSKPAVNLIYRSWVQILITSFLPASGNVSWCTLGNKSIIFLEH